MSEAFILFEAVIEKNSSKTARLGSHAAIIDNHQFESGIKNVQNREGTLTVAK